MQCHPDFSWATLPFDTSVKLAQAFIPSLLQRPVPVHLSIKILMVISDMFLLLWNSDSFSHEALFLKHNSLKI